MVETFRKIENYIHEFVMSYITTNNRISKKLFQRKAYTYKPIGVIKDLQTKIKNNAKYKGLIGSGDPSNISLI